jgi:cation transport regulator
MPYQNKSELPASIQNHLPEHAQEIYLSAFNNAWEEYKDRSQRKSKSSREQTAHKVAWAAVKQKYIKKKGQWVLR